jgi:hypothetical protein
LETSGAGGGNGGDSCTTGTCGPGIESGFLFLTYYLDSGKWVFFAERSPYEDTVVSSLTFYVDGCEYSARNLSQNPPGNQSQWEIFWDIDQSDVEVLVSGSNTPAICGNFTTSVPGDPSQDKTYKATFPFQAAG